MPFDTAKRDSRGQASAGPAARPISDRVMGHDAPPCTRITGLLTTPEITIFTPWKDPNRTEASLP